MKKRRPCTVNHNRSPTNSPRAGVSSSASGSISLRKKSVRDLKKRRLQRGNGDRKTKGVTDDDVPSNLIGVKKKNNAFGSLETLFDIKKPLKLTEVISPSRYIERESDKCSSTSSSESLKNLESLIIDFYRPTNQQKPEQEPNILLESYDTLELRYKNDVSKLEELEFDIIDEIGDQEWDEREGSLIVSGYYGDMADMENPTEIENATVPSAPPEEENSITQSPQIEEVTEATKEKKYLSNEEVEEKAPKPPEYPIPPGVGDGVPPKSGGRSESIISSTALTDSEVIKKMMEADQRSMMIREEIDDIRKQISELKHKEDLTDEDAKKLKDKQESLMTKMKEFDNITRTITKLVGLGDQSSETFSKMYDMLPYPHSKFAIAPSEDTEDEKILQFKEDERKIMGNELKGPQYDRFDSPQPEYPEDKIPRAIICGGTEDKIPKIVIPDSRPKSARCLKKLTGKLSESLNMQEKLAEENAKLEGGKYKLEEVVLEKDNTIDSLQRKLCSVQAEFRIVLKENTELNQQLSSLTNQRSNRSAVCSIGCSGQVSSRSTNRQQSSYSRVSSPRRDEAYCQCKSCMQDQFVDSGTLQSSTVCVNPDNFNPYEKQCENSPRLSGGGSRENGCYYSNTSTEQGSVMCCRGPTAVKVPGASSRSGACPAEMENAMTNYGTNTNQLAQQLESMESEVRNMQMELANVHRERQQLEQQRKLLKCTGPCAPCSCCPPGMPHASPSIHQPPMIPCVTGGSSSLPSQIPSETPIHPVVPMSHAKMTQQHQSPTCSGPCIDAPMGASTCPQQQLRDLREQYARLQEDYRNKLCEVSCLRAEADKMKQETREAREEREKAENRLVDVQERLKIMESEKLKFHGSKEQHMEQEQALLVAKQRYREAQDELEELRTLIQDQANQLEDYRNKYLQAQEQVEEQRRQLDLMEMDNARMNENVTLEIGKVKNHFMGKLAEFAPLVDIVKQTQAKLQEVQQLRLVAERNCEDLTRELLTCKDQLGTLQSQLSIARSENSALHDEKGMGSGRCDELEKKNSELRNENERMKNTIARLEEQESQMQQRVDEKLHEIVQLTAMLEQVREDSARQVARTKERCETVRRTMQGQIAEMEKQLAQCRATARAAQKDRDEIRQKMQGQINNLNEAFEQAQGRIRSLQGHVNYLKTSYSNIFSPGAQGELPPGFMPSETAGQGQGYDSCDCNY